MSQRVEQQAKLQNSKTLTRHWDAFGRNVGYSVDGDRKQSISYSPATGRIAESDGFKWDYLSGSNLKSKLTYPNGATASWIYEAKRDFLTNVTNAYANGTVISAYTYTNDLLGRRTSKNDEQYSYNIRDELIAADEVSYNYDDIGNRTTAEGKTYTANNLNQYTAIDDFVPQYDADGNQTLIKTSTGIWSVTYNAENRPIRWQSGDTVITMAFDCAGRRIEYQEKTSGMTVIRHYFAYNNHLCVQRIDITKTGTDYIHFVWDPTESVATSPLVTQMPNIEANWFYMYDGNKNVDVIFSLMNQEAMYIKYAYDVFGTVTNSVRYGQDEENEFIRGIPFRFASEYYDEVVGSYCYNYRTFLPMFGRWSTRDIVELKNDYLMSNNDLVNKVDILGLTSQTLLPCPQFAKLKKTSQGVFYRTSTDTNKEKRGNGCGAEGGAKFPDKIGLISYRDCCDDHDKCYATCNSNRSDCDSTLGACIRQKCNRMTLAYAAQQCRGTARGYEIAVQKFGEHPWEEAQNKGCIWEPCCPIDTSEYSMPYVLQSIPE